MKEESFWLSGVKAPNYSNTKLPHRVDVVVVGGGMAGISLAYNLGQGGAKVLLVCDGKIARGTLAHGTGMLTQEVGESYLELEQEFGLAKARRVYDSMAFALDQLEDAVHAEHIDADFYRATSLAVTTGVYTKHENRSEHEARKRIGMRSTWVSESEFEEAHPFVQGGGAVATRGEAIAHPYKLALGLAHAFEKAGGIILEDTRYIGAYEEDGVLEIETARGIVYAKDLALMSDQKVRQFIPGIGAVTDLWSTTVVTEPVEVGDWQEREMVHNRFPLQEFARRTHDGRILFSSLRTSRLHPGDNKNIGLMLRNAFGHFFHLPQITFDYIWHTKVPYTRHLLPFMGQVNDRVYAAGGYNGRGLIFGFLAGSILAKQILGKPHPYADLYAELPQSKTWDTALHTLHHFDHIVREDRKLRQKDQYGG